MCYSVLTQIQAILYMQSTKMCLLKSQSNTSSSCFLFHKYILPKCSMSLAWKEKHWCGLNSMTCVRVQNCIYVICRVFGGHLRMCLSIKPSFAFLLLMTVEKAKRMQGNLTLVVSWNVGENQVMEQGAVAWESLSYPFRGVKCKGDVFQRLPHFLGCVLLTDSNGVN